MPRKELFEWLKTCPAKAEVFTTVLTTSDQSGYRVLDDYGEVKVPFSNYLGECEFICELEDYTEDDIKEYFTKEDLTVELLKWKEEHDKKGSR